MDIYAKIGFIQPWQQAAFKAASFVAFNAFLTIFVVGILTLSNIMPVSTTLWVNSAMFSAVVISIGCSLAALADDRLVTIIVSCVAAFVICSMLACTGCHISYVTPLIDLKLQMAGAAFGLAILSGAYSQIAVRA